MNTLEDLVLGGDRRGVSALRPLLSPTFVMDAARLILAHPGKALVVTGFYVTRASAAETDGPPGAAAIASALAELGFEVAYVTDPACRDVVQAADPSGRVIAVPVAPAARSVDLARALLTREAPSILVSVERCGPSADGAYRNFRGEDIAPVTARLDALFDLHPHSVGIGDFGNELGMGCLADVIPACSGLPALPCVTRAERLVVAAVSNLGALGVVAALSAATGRPLLPTVEEDRERLRRCVAAGAVDGMSGLAEEAVDGLGPAALAERVVALRRWVDERLLSGL